MKKLLLALLLVVGVCVSHASVHYMSPTGSDSADGLTRATSWASPNHFQNCGDTIIALTGQYQVSQVSGTFGLVNCPSGSGAAVLACEKFSQCYLNTTNGGGDIIAVHNSYWVVMGWFVSGTGMNPDNLGSCFGVNPQTVGIPVHHVAFINNIAVGCPQSGFGGGVFSNSIDSNDVSKATSTDYIVFLGNIAIANGYTRVGGSNYSVYGPKNLDHKAGTHYYWAFNYGWDSLNIGQAQCDAGGLASGYCQYFDANGIITDSFGNYNFDGDVVIENNLMVHNAGGGIRPEYTNQRLENGGTSSPTGPFPKQLVRNNTTWGNAFGQQQQGPDGGDLQIQNSTNVTFQNNIAVSAYANVYASSSPLAPLQIDASDNTNAVLGNWLYTPFQTLTAGAYPNQVLIKGYYGNTTSGAGYSGAGAPFPNGAFDPSNKMGVDPQLTNPQDPPTLTQTSCQAYTSTTACLVGMGVIQNFMPKLQAAQSYGFQMPLPYSRYDAKFPQWLCTVPLPTGLATRGCISGGVHPATSVM